MKKYLLLAILSVTCTVSAATFSISCHNASLTKTDGSLSIVKLATFSSNGEQAMLKLDDMAIDLPDTEQGSGIHKN